VDTVIASDMSGGHWRLFDSAHIHVLPIAGPSAELGRTEPIDACI
jgi:hypothetical protein